MSRENLTWFNTNTLIGFTAKRGTAWHWRAEEQGETSNHYTGAIPLADVQDRLFYWSADSRQLAVEVPADPQSMTHLNAALRCAGRRSRTGRPSAAPTTQKAPCWASSAPATPATSTASGC